MSEVQGEEKRTEVRGIWRDIKVPNAAGWQSSADEFGLTELQRNIIGSRRNLPQVIEGEEWLLVQFLLPKLQQNQLKLQRLVALVGEKELVTLHIGSLPEDVVEQIIMRTQNLNSPSGILACITDAVTDLYGPILDDIEDIIDSIQDTIMRDPTEKQLHQLFVYKKLLASLRRVILPTTAIIGALSDGRYKTIDKKVWAYLRESYDYMWRARELIEGSRDLLTSALDTYMSVVSNRLNDVMKRLTIVATVFMPISFWASLGGINFTQMPFDSNIAFVSFMVICLILPIAMLIYFRKQGWI